MFNQGNVDSANISVIDYLPEGLELSDSEWTSVPEGASYNFDGLVLAPGESASVDITAVVTPGASQETLENLAEITEVDGVDEENEVIFVQVAGSGLVRLQDIDSTPDAINSESFIDDAIDREDDEDDHDVATLGFIEQNPPVLAFTGNEIGSIVGGSLVLIAIGAMLIVPAYRRRDSGTPAAG